jgi:microcystin-dependent protein
MLTKTIGQLSAATVINDADFIEIEQAGVSKYAQCGWIMPVGAITPYAGASAPGGWLTCDGSAISRTTYAGLFGVLSTTWGVGDGSTTFNIPDLREAAPVGIGTSASLITSTGSTISAHDTYILGEFKDDQLQGHWHDAYRDAAGGTNPSLTGNNTNGASGPQIGSQQIKNPSNDGTNGAPRTGATTRGKRVGVNFIIKY